MHEDKRDKIQIILGHFRSKNQPGIPPCFVGQTMSVMPIGPPISNRAVFLGMSAVSN